MGAELLEKLRAEVAAGRVVFVVGAGVSLGATGGNALAGWPGLLRHGIQRCVELIGADTLDDNWQRGRLDDCGSKDLDTVLGVAQQIERKLRSLSDGAGEYGSWLHDTIGSLRLAPGKSDVADALHASGCPLATTNYDGLLEAATGRPTITWSDNGGANSLRALREDEQAIVHLHGHFRQSDSVVLGLQSYERLLASDTAKNFQHVLASVRTLVFVGCGAGVEDPNFESLRAWMKRTLGSAMHRHYRLAREEELPTLRAIHKGDRIQVVSYGKDHSDLAPFLRKLCVDKERPPPLSDPFGKHSPTLNHAVVRRECVRKETERADLLSLVTTLESKDVSLTDVYVELTLLREGGEIERGQSERQRLTFQQALAEHPRLVIDGKPGSGKTTLLRSHARTLLDAGGIKPMLVRLRDLNNQDIAIERRIVGPKDPPQLLEWLARWHTWELRRLGLDEHAAYGVAELRDALTEGRVLLLLDGFDELAESKRKLFLELFAAFTKGCLAADSKARIVITSRTSTVQDLARHTEKGSTFTRAEVSDLNNDERREMAQSLLSRVQISGAAPDTKCDEDLLQRLDDNGPDTDQFLRDLAATPVMVTLIVLVYRVRRARLPSKRAVLYLEAVRELNRRFLLRAPQLRERDWDEDGLTNCLAHVAWQGFIASDREIDSHRSIELVVARVEEWLVDVRGRGPTAAAAEARELVDLLRKGSGVLTEPENPLQRFVHYTIGEFLAAWHLVSQDSPVIHTTFVERLLDPHWRQVLLLATGLRADGSLGRNGGAKQVSELIGHIIATERPDLIGGLAPALAELRLLGIDCELPFEPLRKVRESRLVEWVGDQRQSQATRIGVGEVLGYVGDSRIRSGGQSSRNEHDERARHFSRWCEIEGGEFMYGPYPELVRTKIASYALQRWLVTIEEYARFVEADGYLATRYWRSGGDSERQNWLTPGAWTSQLKKASNHPVVGVSWFEAKAYCAWLTETEGGGRFVIDLPTDEQWEAAARGLLRIRNRDGTGAFDNPLPTRDYPWVHESDMRTMQPRFDATKANSHPSTIARTTPVGCYPGGHGPHGHWDQAGNVYEWCLDASDGVSGTHQIGPYWRVTLAPGAFGRVVRGGCFGNASGSVRCSLRNALSPMTRRGEIGFRPARVATEHLHYFITDVAKENATSGTKPKRRAKPR